MTGYGNSAAREAARLRADARRGVWRRLLALLGFEAADARTEAVAARWEVGAEGEAVTARMLGQLRAYGWHVLNDRQLPGSRANLDHVLVSPCGTAMVVLDTKRWHAQKPTWLVRGRVFCGTEDRHAQIEAVAGYARRVAGVVGLPAGQVWPLIVVHKSQVQGGFLRVRVDGFEGPVFVLDPAHLVPTLVNGPKGRHAGRADALQRRAASVLPPYR